MDIELCGVFFEKKKKKQRPLTLQQIYSLSSKMWEKIPIFRRIIEHFKCDNKQKVCVIVGITENKKFWL